MHIYLPYRPAHSDRLDVENWEVDFQFNKNYLRRLLWDQYHSVVVFHNADGILGYIINGFQWEVAGSLQHSFFCHFYVEDESLSRHR